MRRADLPTTQIITVELVRVAIGLVLPHEVRPCYMRATRATLALMKEILDDKRKSLLG